jgi:hypothetical protein
VIPLVSFPFRRSMVAACAKQRAMAAAQQQKHAEIALTEAV